MIQTSTSSIIARISLRKPSTPSRVRFQEEATVIHILRKTDEEKEHLFWHAEDYERMRKEYFEPRCNLLSFIVERFIGKDHTTIRQEPTMETTSPLAFVKLRYICNSTSSWISKVYKERSIANVKTTHLLDSLAQFFLKSSLSSRNAEKISINKVDTSSRNSIPM